MIFFSNYKYLIAIATVLASFFYTAYIWAQGVETTIIQPKETQVTEIQSAETINDTQKSEEQKDRLVPPLAIEGYSVISYFTKNKAEVGNVKYSSVYDNQTYLFTSAEQVETFNRNPRKYIPRYEYCPYGLSIGMQLPLDPTNFKVVGQSLLLFHKGVTHNGTTINGKTAWEKEAEKYDNEKKLLERADKHYTLLRF